MTISVGDFVRSFDFPQSRDLDGDRACFMEGRVVDFKELEGCRRYVIDVSRCIFGGEVRAEFPKRIYPPVNGTRRMFGGVCNGVELV